MFWMDELIFIIKIKMAIFLLKTLVVQFLDIFFFQIIKLNLGTSQRF